MFLHIYGKRNKRFLVLTTIHVHIYLYIALKIILSCFHNVPYLQKEDKILYYNIKRKKSHYLKKSVQSNQYTLHWKFIRINKVEGLWHGNKHLISYSIRYSLRKKDNTIVTLLPKINKVGNIDWAVNNYKTKPLQKAGLSKTFMISQFVL